MNFEVPTIPVDTATYLRDLEQSAPKTIPRDIRAALIQASRELDAWKLVGEQVARAIEEAANVRISEMASTSRVSEIQRGIQQTLRECASRLRALP